MFLRSARKLHENLDERLILSPLVPLELQAKVVRNLYVEPRDVLGVPLAPRAFAPPPPLASFACPPRQSPAASVSDSHVRTSRPASPRYDRADRLRLRHRSKGASRPVVRQSVVRALVSSRRIGLALALEFAAHHPSTPPVSRVSASTARISARVAPPASAKSFLRHHCL